MKSPNQKVALVTGATRGVGKGVAAGLADAGVFVYATGRSIARADLRPGVVPVACDSKDAGAVARVFERIQAECGRLDVLVNCAWGGYEQMVEDGQFTWPAPFWQQPLTVEERWTSTGLKPSFHDYVVHEGHAFGFDGSILACIDLKDGKRKWKGGCYGHGQLVLLPDQDLLLGLSEEGELALVMATSDQFAELARFPAIEGKTWNHPVLVGDILLVRNGEEMAAFRLSLDSRLSPASNGG